MGRSRVTSSKYMPPSLDLRKSVSLMTLCDEARPIDSKQQRRLQLDDLETDASPMLLCVGNTALAKRYCVAIVGTRDVSSAGANRAADLAKALVASRVVVVSGLAKGVDTFALSAAIEAGGDVIAVIGTPLNQAYPKENATLQETIYRKHLLISQYKDGTQVQKHFFPQRNKIMAAVSDATVIIEASDTSGTLHQAAECTRLGRMLFVAKEVVDDPKLTWPARFSKNSNFHVFASPEDLIQRLPLG